MELLSYIDFVNEHLLLEGINPEALKASFVAFEKRLGRKKTDLMNYVRTDLASELGSSFTGLVNDSNIITVYDTVIKIRSAQGARLEEFSKDAKKTVADIMSGLEEGKMPSNRYEKGAALVVYLMDVNPDAIFWAPKDSLKKETMALNAIKSNLDKLKGPNETVRIAIHGEIFSSTPNVQEVVLEGVDKVEGTPKADFMFMIEGNPPIYISHKDGKTAKDFQQYGGLDNLRDHPFAKEFIERIRKLTSGELKNGQEFAVKIPVDQIDLGIRAMFGTDATSNNKNWSADNIQLIMQGDITFTPSKVEQFENAYEITPSGHAMYNPVLTGGKLKMTDSDPYWPAIYVSFRNGQGGSFGFKNARFGIWAQGNLGVDRGIKKLGELEKSNTPA
jgi:hypothetical protein